MGDWPRDPAGFQPTLRANRGRLRVSFRSIPPSTAASSAPVHSTWSEPVAGQRKVPCSSRFIQTAVAIPIQDLDPVASPVGEDEEVARERVAGDDVAGQASQAVIPLAEVGRRHGDEDPDGAHEAQHGPDSNAMTTRRKVSSSNPGPTATRRPPPRMTSMAAWSAGRRGRATSANRTGRNAPEIEVDPAEPIREPESKPAKKRKVSRVSSKKAGVTGRTFYMHDDLFALIRGKAIKRKETVSEFASWVFEAHFGVQISTRKRKSSDASGAGGADAA